MFIKIYLLYLFTFSFTKFLATTKHAEIERRQHYPLDFGPRDKDQEPHHDLHQATEPQHSFRPKGGPMHSSGDGERWTENAN